MTAREETATLREEKAGVREEAANLRDETATRALIAKHAPDRLETPIQTYDDPLGVALRNRMIVARALAHMKEAGAGIYIQQCGRGHMFGNAPEGKEFQDSLAALFAAAGVDVLTVFPTGPGYGREMIPEEGKGMLQQGLVIEGLSHARFSFHSSPGAEADFLERLNQHSRGEIGIADDDGNLRAELTSWLKSEIPSWIAAVTPA